MRAVGKIQTGDVHAQAKQVAHRSFGVASRADGADDLGAAGRGHGGRGGNLGGDCGVNSGRVELLTIGVTLVSQLSFEDLLKLVNGTAYGQNSSSR